MVKLLFMPSPLAQHPDGASSMCEQPASSPPNWQMLDTESVRSWLNRTALGNGLQSSAQLLRVLQLSRKLVREVDQGGCWSHAASVPAWRTPPAGPALAHASVARLLSALRNDDGPLCRRWLLPTSRGFEGYVVCTHCLHEGPSPFWRNSWRLACTFKCPHHAAPLWESCPHCHRPLGLLVDKACPAHSCGHCGKLLACRHSMRRRPAVTLPGWLDAPTRTGSGHFPVDVTEPIAWWEGCHVLATIVIRSKWASRLLEQGLPDDLQQPLRELAAPARRSFEGLRLEMRIAALRLVEWWTDSWPQRFVGVARSMGLTAWTIRASEGYVPYWLASVTDECLNARRYRASNEEALAALTVLDDAPSRKAVKQLLGVTDSKAVTGLLGRARHQLTGLQLALLCRWIDTYLRLLPVARSTRASAVRDACCIAVAMHRGILLSKASRISLREGAMLRNTWSTRCGDAVAGELYSVWSRWLNEYMDSVRPAWLRYSHEFDSMFITRFSRPYEGHGAAGLLSKAMQANQIQSWRQGAYLLVAARPTPDQTAFAAHPR